MTSAMKERALAVAQVSHFMERTGLVLADLIDVGGEDFASSNLIRAEKARRVERCWSLMARLGVKYAYLANSPQPLPDKPSRTRSGEGYFSEITEIADLFDTDPSSTKSSEINHLANSLPLEPPETNGGSS